MCEHFGAARDLCDQFEAEYVGVDMPIGLAAAGLKTAEQAVRSLLGDRRSSLFPSPAHAVLECHDWADALATNRSVAGRGLSKQVFNLLPRIRELRSVVSPEDQPRFSEVHPEMSFAVMAHELTATKRTVLGQLQRLSVIEQRVGPLLDWATTVGSAVEGFTDSQPSDLVGARLDDVLDACAAAWSAGRLAGGVADVVGEDDGLDPDGYQLTISI